MKTFLIIFISALSIMSLNAKCSYNGLTVFPTGKTLRQNSIIVIDGYLGSYAVIIGLNKKHPVFLVNEKQKVKLNVKEILNGEFGLTQAVLIPDTILTVGLDYTLVIDSLPSYEKLYRWNSNFSRREPIVYKVVDGLDTTKPVFKKIPQEIKKSIIELGCGPEIFVVFECNVIDSSECLIKATVKSKKTGKETSYYVEPENGILNIGHGMCSGAFVFDEGDKYEIEFSIMDSSGNFNLWTGNRIKFTKPIYKSDVPR